MESPSCSQDPSARRPSSLILYSRSKGAKRAEMESPPSSPTSLVVSSPRRTMSLLRERRSSTFSSDPEERKSPVAMAGFAAEHGPKPSEVYGFVGSITTVIATVIYLVWAYTPEPWLHSLGITYYPSKHWALAVPTFFMVAIVLVIAFYIGLNFMVTPPPTSFDTMFDEYSREPTTFVPMEGEEKPIEPISDMDISYVNYLMFGGQDKCGNSLKISSNGPPPLEDI